MFLYFLLLIIFSANVWLGWVLAGWLGIGVFMTSIPVVIIATLGGGLILGLAGMLFGKHSDRRRGQRFLRHFLRGWGWLVCFAWLIPWIFFGLLQLENNVAPATLPKITITNGEKIVVFQSMMHIASPGFYREIRKDMENLRGQDYVFFYEGVRTGTPESMEKLNALVGVDISEEMYTMFAQMGGLVIQDPSIFVGIIPSTNVDLSTDEIVAIAEGKNIAPALGMPDIVSRIETAYPQFNDTQKFIARAVSRGLMNVLLQTYSEPGFAEELKQTMPVFDVILDERNTHLAQAIIASPVPNIYIHYGAMHYAGVLKFLQEKDRRWEEIARTEYQVIR